MAARCSRAGRGLALVSLHRVYLYGEERAVCVQRQHVCNREITCVSVHGPGGTVLASIAACAHGVVVGKSTMEPGDVIVCMAPVSSSENARTSSCGL